MADASWKVAFVAQREDIGEGVQGYKLGPSDYIINPVNTLTLKNVGNTYLFIYFASKAQCQIALNWDEFAGVGETLKECFTDIVTRVLLGTSKRTIDELKYMFRADWYIGGEWHSGDLHDYETAGSPPLAYFRGLIDLFGAV